MAASHRVKRSPKKKQPQKSGLSSRQRTWLWCGLLVLLFVVAWSFRHQIGQWLGYSPAARTTQSGNSWNTTTAQPQGGASASTRQVQIENLPDSEINSSTSTTTNRSSTTTTTSEHTTRTSTAEEGTQETQNSLLTKVLNDIGIGDSKQDLLGLGVDPGTCIPVSVAPLGKQEICTLTSSNQTLSVTLLNNKVIDIKKLGL